MTSTWDKVGERIKTAAEFYERHQWHDLEEGDLELDIGTRYLCVLEHRYIDDGNKGRVVCEYNGEGSWSVDGWKTIEPYHVTHAMPLPELPEVQS